MGLKELSLLFVEDDSQTRMLIERVLGEMVRNYYQAADGKHGLELFRTKVPDIVVTDIEMPRMDGFTMVREIRKTHPSTPILILSAFDRREVLLEAIDIGVDAFVVKPVDLVKFLGKLEEIAERLKKVRYAEKSMRNRIEELEFKAHYDSISRIPNRHMFELSLDRSVAEADERKSGLGLLLIDIDDFKTINDRYGHPAGDTALRTLARIISENVRKDDQLFRIGGDEFALLIREVGSPESLHTFAEKISRLTSTILDYRGQQMPLHCSIGGSIYPDAAVNRDELIEQADAMLYEVKRSGKKSFRLYEPR